MRRELAVPLPEGTLNDDMYLPLEAFFRGYRVILDDSALAFDYPTPLASEFRRKVRTLAGVYQIVGSYPALLGPRNRMWIHFFSHKLARLVMPWAMILAAGASFGLPERWRVLGHRSAGRILLCGVVRFLDAWQFSSEAFNFPYSHVRGVDAGVALLARDHLCPGKRTLEGDPRQWRTRQAPQSRGGDWRGISSPVILLPNASFRQLDMPETEASDLQRGFRPRDPRKLRRSIF